MNFTRYYLFPFSIIKLIMQPEMESKLQHLAFIQSVIDRMSKNSFLLKGWGVTLVSALFALAAKDANKQYILLAYFPIITFLLKTWLEFGNYGYRTDH